MIASPGIIAFRNQLDNRSDNFVSKLVGGFDHGPTAALPTLTAEPGFTHYLEEIRRFPDKRPRKSENHGGARHHAGRIAGGINQSTAEFRALIRQHDDANVEALIEMRDNDDNPWVRLAAIQILFDRGHGGALFRQLPIRSSDPAT
jgi:hypothetical protein